VYWFYETLGSRKECRTFTGTDVKQWNDAHKHALALALKWGHPVVVSNEFGWAFYTVDVPENEE
jgi:hypothetical protein